MFFRRLGRWIKNYRVYTLQVDYRKQTGIFGFRYESMYVQLTTDGFVRIKKGYTWNGCSPKYDVFGVVLGTPEGTYNDKGLSRTYHPSLIHDVLYQASEVLPRLRRKDVDLLFYDMLRAEGLGVAFLYYVVVRLFGSGAWGPAE